MHFSALVAHPDRKRCAPIPFARNAPVDDVFKEIAHSALFDGVGHPVDRIVGSKKLLLDSSHLHKPARTCIVKKRSVASPTERITVSELQSFEKFVFAFKFLDDIFVGVFAEQSFKIVNGIFESASVVNHLHERKIVFFADFAVVLAECGCDMDYTRAVGESNVRVVRDVITLFLCTSFVVEKRFVFDVFVLAALLGVNLDVFCFVFEKGRNKRVGKNIELIADLNFGVVLFCVHAKRDVGRERPRSRRPGKKIGVVDAFELEFDEYGSFLDVFVALRNFVRRERGSATRAIRHDFVALVDKPLVCHLFDCPPHRLDVIVVVGDIRVFHVRPVADAVGHLLPLVGVFPNGLLALFDKRLDSVFFDFLFAVNAELFFDFKFDGQTVSVPARFAQDVISLHGFVTRDNVLHDTGENVTDVRFSVCGRWSVIKTKFGIAFVFLYALFENVLFFPKSENFFFAVDEIQICFNGFVHIVL
jgi:hypothetical protein